MENLLEQTITKRIIKISKEQEFRFETIPNKTLQIQLIRGIC